MDDQMQNLVLNDRSVTLEQETSNALGLGWRLGFLGSLHASVFKRKIRKEYGAKIILTAPPCPTRLSIKMAKKELSQILTIFQTTRNITMLKAIWNHMWRR